MNPSSSHHPRGHIVHPWELAMLVHNYDRQMELQQNQLTYIRQAQTALRRAAPVISELLDRVGPNVPNYEFLYEPRELLTQMQQPRKLLSMKESNHHLHHSSLMMIMVSCVDRNHTFRHLCSDAACVHAAAVHLQNCNVTTNYLGDQPWPHVEPQDYTVFQAWRSAARIFMQTDQALGIPDKAP